MKVTFCVALAALVATIAAAQQPAPAKITIAAGIQRGYDTIKRNLMEAAEKMPEADYAFKPTPEIRSYGQLFGHVANSQFNTCAAARGEANPNQGNDNEQKTTKAEFVKALTDSFAFCDPAYAALTDETAMQFITLGRNEVMRAVALANNVSHDNEMYGVAGVYMRLKGLVPPSTERQMQR
jgi:hypothetical protein